jgi:hypothetical protein
MSRFATCNEVCPQIEELLVKKLSENLPFSDDNPDSDEDQGQQEGDNVDCDPTFETCWSSSEPSSLTQEHLNLVRDLNFSNNKLILGSRIKGWKTSPHSY